MSETVRPSTFEPVPSRLEDLLQPDWLGTALADLEPGEHVAHVEVLGTSQTLAQKVRLSVVLERADGHQRTRTYCVKGQFDDGQQTMQTETRFYRDLRPRLDLRAPHAHYTGIDEASGRTLVVMDDVESDGGRFPGAHEPWPVERCRDALAQLARLHAATWDDDRWEVDWLGSRVALMTDFYPVDVLQRLLDDGRATNVADELRDARRLVRAMTATATMPPTCVIHGDTHSGNVFLDAAGRAGWLDFQVSQRGHWSIDVSYHLATVLDVEDRRAHERDLLRAYLDELGLLGIEPPAWDDAWRDYTRAFTWGYFLWVITQISSRAVVLVHLPRIAAALDDHDTFRRLGAT